MALVDRELYLPAVWTTDRERRQAAGVPESVGFATKPQLAVGCLRGCLAVCRPPGWPQMRCMARIPGCGPGWRAAGWGMCWASAQATTSRSPAAPAAGWLRLGAGAEVRRYDAW